MASTADSNSRDGGRSGFNDLRMFVVAADFVGQAQHSTAKRNYQDTVNIAIAPQGGASRVRAFSSSGIGGAFGDSGQNYRNLQNLMRGVQVEGPERIVFGCGGS